MRLLVALPVRPAGSPVWNPGVSHHIVEPILGERGCRSDVVQNHFDLDQAVLRRLWASDWH